MVFTLSWPQNLLRTCPYLEDELYDMEGSQEEKAVQMLISEREGVRVCLLSRI